jgi:acetyl-CoA carboxylase biotin carboxyl carrier protein
MTTIKAQDIEALIESFEASNWKELRLKIEGLELFLSKDAAARGGLSAAPATLAPPPAQVQGESSALHATHATAAPHLTRASPPPGAPSSKAVPDGWVAVRAPNLGTFYRAPKPGAEPYVAVGQRVDATTEVCLIEVMKLFTSVPAGVAGIVRDALVKDSELVEFDQPLFLIEPA